MKLWTDIDDDPDGWLEVEIEVRGPRVLAEKLAEGEPLEFVEPEPACECSKCKKIRKRVRVKLRRARRAAGR